MNTSHHDGGAPDVFSQSADARHVQFVEQNKRVVEHWKRSKPTCHLSDEQLGMLRSIEQAAEAIAAGARKLGDPDIPQDVAEVLFDSHKHWHQRFTRSSNRLFKELRHQLEMEGLQ